MALRRPPNRGPSSQNGGARGLAKGLRHPSADRRGVPCHPAAAALRASGGEPCRTITAAPARLATGTTSQPSAVGRRCRSPSAARTVGGTSSVRFQSVSGPLRWPTRTSRSPTGGSKHSTRPGSSFGPAASSPALSMSRGMLGPESRELISTRSPRSWSKCSTAREGYALNRKITGSAALA